MSEEFDVLKLVVERLDQNSVPYMITGSIATNFYTIPRMTRDIDIVVELKKPKVHKVYQAFKDEFYIEQNAIKEAIMKQSSFNIIHNQKLVKVDFIIKKQSEYRRLEFRRRRSVAIEGITVSIVSQEDLIISKLYWAKESHSEIQLNDVRSILEDSEGIDKKYLKKWISALGLEDIYQEVS